MKRRTFMQLSALGGTATAFGLNASVGSARSTDTEFALTISPASAEMIDGTMVHVLAYFLGLNDPSPEIRVTEGDEITIFITNNDSDPHGFAIPGIPAATIDAIEPGATATVIFNAPFAGSFLYIDPFKEPLNRVLGLHGAFIVEVQDGRTPAGSETPYSAPQQTPQVQAIFDAMGGGNPRFPGDKWRHNDLRKDKLWLFSQTDPLLNASVAAGEAVDPAKVKANFLPRYFTINGLSGFDAAHSHGGDHEPAERIIASGKQGEPCLIRTMNAGLANHAVHIHGNHCFQLSTVAPDFSNACRTFAYERDTWLLAPMGRIDMLLPFTRPPDIPLDAWPPQDEPFPLSYVMHCHFELSQTAGGGNYPQGAVTHWEMTAPL
ncbi:multicopper oxidase domain-containing protein [Qipengyuania sp. SM2507]